VQWLQSTAVPAGSFVNNCSASTCVLPVHRVHSAASSAVDGVAALGFFERKAPFEHLLGLQSTPVGHVAQIAAPIPIPAPRAMTAVPETTAIAVQGVELLRKPLLPDDVFSAAAETAKTDKTVVGNIIFRFKI